MMSWCTTLLIHYLLEVWVSQPIRNHSNHLDINTTNAQVQINSEYMYDLATCELSLCKRKQWNGEISWKTYIRPVESPSCLPYQVFWYGGFKWCPLSPTNRSPSAQGQNCPAESLVPLQWHVCVGDHLYNSVHCSAHCVTSCTSLVNRFYYLRCIVEYFPIIG